MHSVNRIPLVALLLSVFWAAGECPAQSTSSAPPDSIPAERAAADTTTLMPEMVVRSRAVAAEAGRQELTVEEIEQLAGFGGDVIKSLQSLPSVARPSMTDPGAVIVRGSSSLDTRYLLDGVDIPLLFHYGGLKSTYTTLALDGVELFPGGYNSRYGGCIGGVVEIRGRAGREDRWRRAVDVSLLDASLFAEGPIGRGASLLLSARRSYAGEVINSALENQDDIRMAVVPYFWDLVARVDWRPTWGNHLFLTCFASQDRMELVFPGEGSGSEEVSDALDTISNDLSFSRFILGWDREILSGGDWDLANELRAAAGHTTQAGQVFGWFEMDARGPLYSVRDELSIRHGRSWRARVGVDLIWAPINYLVEVAGWPDSRVDELFSDFGFYANVDLHPMEKLLLVPGLRYDHYNHLDEGRANLRLTARYDLSEAHTLTGAIGNYDQSPQPIGQSTDPVYGNPALPPTLASHLTFGDEWWLGDNLTVHCEAYYNTQSQIPVETDSLGLNFATDSEARMYGLEIMLRRASDPSGEGRFFGWLSYSLARSQRRYRRSPETTISSEWDSSEWVLSPMDQTHNLSAVGSWRISRDWTVGARVQFVSGNPETPLLNYVSDHYEFDADEGEYVPIGGAYLSDRLKPFFRFDFRVEKAFRLGRFDCSVYADVQNLNYFLYNSPEGYTYNFDYSRREEYGWIILPALGCRAEF